MIPGQVRLIASDLRHTICIATAGNRPGRPFQSQFIVSKLGEGHPL